MIRLKARRKGFTATVAEFLNTSKFPKMKLIKVGDKPEPTTSRGHMELNDIEELGVFNNHLYHALIEREEKLKQGLEWSYELQEWIPIKSLD